jgi:hypothetical protein
MCQDKMLKPLKNVSNSKIMSEVTGFSLLFPLLKMLARLYSNHLPEDGNGGVQA